MTETQPKTIIFLVSGFRKRGLAKGVSPSFLQMKRKETEEKEENGKKKNDKIRNPKKNSQKGTERTEKRKKTEEIGSDTVPRVFLNRV